MGDRHSDDLGLLALADFQAQRVEAMQQVTLRTLRHQEQNPDKREALARDEGVMLLQSPTGSGKTLMLGRTLDGLIGRGPGKLVWFWFAPFSGLVEQTRDALADQCPALRLRDLTKDREPTLARDGDVFVHTWAAVAANNKDARRVRRDAEGSFSLDTMLEVLRLAGFSIGVVIDEAHQNFGTNAKAAAAFYLETLRPDVTLLATATPNDEKLERFEKAAGVRVQNRLVVSREEVVARGLNKTGLNVGFVRLREEDRDLVDPETAALSAGWQQHNAIKERLEELDVSVVPLMLVQVEDAGTGQEPTERVREKLEAIGVPSSVIATHTSGNPDPEFHTIAFDPSREVLIFKVSVATGFDAPRAWTLVSVRPNRGRDFGLQIVGRITRVHALVRPLHGNDPLIDRGNVFLTDEIMQEGLASAAEELKAVRSSIEVVTDSFDFVELGTVEAGGELGERRVPSLMPQQPTDADRQRRLALLIEERRVPGSVLERPTEEQDRAIVAAEMTRHHGGDLFGSKLPELAIPKAGVVTSGGGEKTARYPMEPAFNVPERLYVELPPDPETYNSDSFIDAVAREFIERSALLQNIFRRKTTARVVLKDVFDEQATETEDDISILLDDKRIVEAGQYAFDFNDSIDDRLLKRAILAQLKKSADDNGFDYVQRDLTRAMYLAAMREPDALRSAQKMAMTRHVRARPADDPIPRVLFDLPDLPPAKRCPYGVFPSGLNKPETAFAQFLDEDATGRVKWWIRNPHRAGGTSGWSTNLVLPSSKWFFPDFIVGVQGRSTQDEIALAEIKGDGTMNLDESLDKIQVVHRTYQAVLWAADEDKTLVRLSYDRSTNRIRPLSAFRVDDLLSTAQ
ncbi:MAG: DEAD/DEAH box helicase family protein [Pseudomonadota bacterium]